MPQLQRPLLMMALVPVERIARTTVFGPRFGVVSAMNVITSAQPEQNTTRLAVSAGYLAMLGKGTCNCRFNKDEGSNFERMAKC
ncbi:MAG: hypothetical protein O9337_05605 [Acidovorax sp.]|nr:hypothetical protein [Acidovorax sp.]